MNNQSSYSVFRLFCSTRHCLWRGAPFFRVSIFQLSQWFWFMHALYQSALLDTGLQTWSVPSTFHRIRPWMVYSLSSDLFVGRTVFVLVRLSENNMAEMSLYTGQCLCDHLYVLPGRPPAMWGGPVFMFIYMYIHFPMPRLITRMTWCRTHGYWRAWSCVTSTGH